MSGSKEITPLDKANDRVLRALSQHEIGSEEYAKTLELAIKIHKMRQDEKPQSVSKDTLVLAGANLIGIFMILRHEYVNVITSKAIGLLLRPR